MKVTMIEIKHYPFKGILIKLEVEVSTIFERHHEYSQKL